ncbi:MAG TPA: hypothetical protein VM687_02890 [Stenotrophomonas sp.]|nr:hypothetical protein [Stenotrophomonas sp.]
MQGTSTDKRQQTQHPHGNMPGTRKPAATSPGSESEELVRGYDGQPALAPELGSLPKPYTGNYTPGTPLPTAPQPESFWHILSDTLENPAARAYQTWTQIGAWVFKGRDATPEEIATARKIAMPVDIAAKVLAPEIFGTAAGVGTAVDVTEQWATTGTVDPKTLIGSIQSVAQPGQGGKISSTAGTPTAAAGKSKSFNPPTRQPDGKIGYVLSPTGAPRLGKEGDAAAAKPRADAPPSTTHFGTSTGAESTHTPTSFRSSFNLRTAYVPSTGKVDYQEFARDETYRQRPPSGADDYFDIAITADGYNSNYRGKGMEAIVLHGSPSRSGGNERLFYQRGRDVKVVFQPTDPSASGAADDAPYTQFQKMDFAKDVSGAELVDRLRQEQHLDLVSSKYGGTAADAPLYLLACSACRGGSESTAQQLADATGREVRAHSRFPIRVVNPNLLSHPGAAPLASLPASRILAHMRNAFRPHRTRMNQLVHTKFRPDPEAAADAQALREANPNRRPSIQIFPRPEYSTFTPTQGSTAATSKTGLSMPSAPPTDWAGSSASSPVPPPQPGSSGLKGDAFFDHVPPPRPPTKFLLMKPAPIAQHPVLTSSTSGSSVGSFTMSQAATEKETAV